MVIEVLEFYPIIFYENFIDYNPMIHHMHTLFSG